MRNKHQTRATGYSNNPKFQSVEPSEIVCDGSQPRGSPTSGGARPVIYSPDSFSNTSNCSISSRFENGFGREQLCSANPDDYIQITENDAQTLEEDVTQFDQAQSELSLNKNSTGSNELQESCLLRYFIEELSPWVGLLKLKHTRSEITRSSSITVMSDDIFN